MGTNDRLVQDHSDDPENPGTLSFHTAAGEDRTRSPWSAPTPGAELLTSRSVECDDSAGNMTEQPCTYPLSCGLQCKKLGLLSLE
jgi:hypothetical protein